MLWAIDFLLVFVGFAVGVQVGHVVGMAGEPLDGGSDA